MKHQYRWTEVRFQTRFNLSVSSAPLLHDTTDCADFTAEVREMMLDVIKPSMDELLVFGISDLMIIHHTASAFDIYEIARNLTQNLEYVSLSSNTTVLIHQGHLMWAARGAAELAKRSQEAPGECVENEVCKARRKELDATHSNVLLHPSEGQVKLIC